MSFQLPKRKVPRISHPYCPGLYIRVEDHDEVVNELTEMLKRASKMMADDGNDYGVVQIAELLNKHDL